jgi:hypothetical protein
MNHALKIVHGPVPAESSKLITSWLDALFAMLRLPEKERVQVRDELACHLDERVRDLLITGMSEEQAAVRAIAELGDAAVLARRFHAAHAAPRRRSMMNLGMIGLATAGVIACGAYLRTEPPAVRTSVFSVPLQATDTPPAPKFAMELHGARWGEFFDYAGRLYGKPVSVYWKSIGELDQELPENSVLGPDISINVDISGVTTLDGALEMLNAELVSTKANRLEYRNEKDRLVFATTHYFDARETTLATFDVTTMVVSRLDPLKVSDVTIAEGTSQLCTLISSLIEPEGWRENGGDCASIRSFGGKLFVKAPRRVLAEVEWILGEAKTQDADAINAARPIDAFTTIEIAPPAILIPTNHLIVNPTLAADGTVNIAAELCATVDLRLKHVDSEAARQVLDGLLKAVPLSQKDVTRTVTTWEDDSHVRVTSSPELVRFSIETLKLLDQSKVVDQSKIATPEMIDEVMIVQPVMLDPTLIIENLERIEKVAPIILGKPVSMSNDANSRAIKLSGPVKSVERLVNIARLLERDWNPQHAGPGAAVPLPASPSAPLPRIVKDAYSVVTAFFTSDWQPAEAAHKPNLAN